MLKFSRCLEQWARRSGIGVDVGVAWGTEAERHDSLLFFSAVAGPVGSVHDAGLMIAVPLAAGEM